MIELYHAGGSQGFSVGKDVLSGDQKRVLFENAARLLTARGQVRAAELLQALPFSVAEGTNDFGDEFCMLMAAVPLEEYERLRIAMADETERAAFRQMSKVLTELGTVIRFITVELSLEQSPSAGTRTVQGLKQSEINKVVYKYIGVNGGYLGDFSYQTHRAFYIELDLDINPYNVEGTTRERFIQILKESSPDIQARILQGIIRRFPVGSSGLRTSELAAEIRGWIGRLQSGPLVEAPDLRITSDVVERALRDAQELLRTTGATSGVDRVHTALHGYLREVCTGAGIGAASDASITELFKHVRENHSAFIDFGPQGDDIVRVVRALATIVDTLNPLRNKASVAHPNRNLLAEPEATLVINVVRSLFHYIDQKIHRHSQS